MIVLEAKLSPEIIMKAKVLLKTVELVGITPADLLLVSELEKQKLSKKEASNDNHPGKSETVNPPPDFKLLGFILSQILQEAGKKHETN